MAYMYFLRDTCGYYILKLICTFFYYNIDVCIETSAVVASSPRGKKLRVPLPPISVTVSLSRLRLP